MTEPIVWREPFWQRPLDPVLVADLMRQSAADQRSPQLVLEVRLTTGGAHYLIGANVDAVLTPFKALPSATPRTPKTKRQPVVTAGRLSVNTRHRPCGSTIR